MEEDRAREIQRLKEELEKKRGEVEDIRTLVNKQIDRPFPADVKEYSEKELETYIREQISTVENCADPRPDKKSVTSHRKIIGRPIVFFKRLLLKMTGFHVHLLLDKQTQFNRESAALNQALVIRLGHHKERMRQIQEKISACEEGLVVLEKKVEELFSSRERDKEETENRKPPAQD
jgi:hypothetical protein